MSKTKYEKRQELKKRVQARKHLRPVADREAVDKLLNETIDMDATLSIIDELDAKNSMETNVDVSDESVEELLKSLKKDFDQNKFSDLIEECKQTTVNSVVTTFGLGHVVSASKRFGDQDGGEVTTLHNFKKGITATEEDRKRYEASQKAYDRKDYEKGIKDENGNTVVESFKTKRKNLLKNNETITDGYTGNELPKDGRMELDHIVSAKEINSDEKNHLFLSKEERVAMSMDDKNITPTSKSLNASKKEKKLDEWMEKEENRKSVDEDGNVTTEVKKNKDHYGVDEERAKVKDQEARDHIKKTQTRAQIKKQGSELMKTGAKAGAKMGLQQSLGLMIGEFTNAVFDEVYDVYKHGFKGDRLDDSFFVILKERLSRISKRVVSKWKDAVVAFKDGAISGFFSNFITFIVNCFKTTSGRITRIVREGFMSLIKAFKLMIKPPEGMTGKQIAHEVSKLVGAAIVTTGGILVEESVEKFLKSIAFLAPFAEFLSVAIVGLLTGLLTTFVIYAIDRLDLFGAIREERDEYINSALNQKMDASLENASEVIISLEESLV